MHLANEIRWLAAAAAAAGLLAGCGRQVRDQDADEFSFPAIRKARAKLLEGDKPAALALLNEALDGKPRLAQAHLEAAQLYDEFEHDYARAIYHYERYLELRPETEKREMIEGFIRKAKIAFAAVVAAQIPGADQKTKILEAEAARLKQELRQVRENLARHLAGAPAAARTPAPGPAASGPAPAKPDGESYRVQPGDTLSKLAARFYQNPRLWTRIHEANRDVLGDSQNLKIGQTLVIPK